MYLLFPLNIVTLSSSHPNHQIIMTNQRQNLISSSAVNQQHSENEYLHRELAKLKNDLNVAQDFVIRLQKKDAEKTNQFEEDHQKLKLGITGAYELIKKYEDDLAKMNMSLMKTRDENEHLKRSLDAVYKTNDCLQNEFENLRKLNESLASQQSATLSQANKQLGQQLTALGDQIKLERDRSDLYSREIQLLRLIRDLLERGYVSLRGIIRTKNCECNETASKK